MKTLAVTASRRRKGRVDRAIVSGADAMPFATAARKKRRKKATRGRTVVHLGRG
jgi:hypothetical protein